MVMLLVFMLISMMLTLLPVWPHSRNWGYFPTGSTGIVVVLLCLAGRLTAL